MKRIRDNYNWSKMEHWKQVVERNEVELINVLGENLSEKELSKVVYFLMQDCFPITIICCVRNGKKKIIGTPIWKDIFCFLNNERKIEKNGNFILYKDLSEEEKRKILNAKINSMWLDME